MQLNLVPVAFLAATVAAQGWGQQSSNNYGQQPQNNYQPSPPGGQGGSWTYQGSYGPGAGSSGPSQSSDFPNLKQPEIDAW